MRPTAHSLSFASPKESKQRKGDPTVCVPSLRCGQPAVLEFSGVWLELALRAQTIASPDPLTPALLGAYRRELGDSRAIAALGRVIGPTSALRADEVGIWYPAVGLAGSAVMRRRVAQVWADQGWRLFERSEFEPDPARTEQRSVPAGPTNPARLLLLTFLGEARKVRRPPGRNPACQKIQPSDRKKLALGHLGRNMR